MRSQLKSYKFRALLFFILCKHLLLVNASIATTLSAPYTAISVDKPAGTWIEVGKFDFMGSPPNYNGIRNYCTGLGNDGSNYAVCAVGEKSHSGNHGGSIEGFFYKTTGTINGPNNSTMEVGITFNNMGVYFAGQKYNTGHADARAILMPLSGIGFVSPSENAAAGNEVSWESGSWGLKTNNGCSVFNQCNRTKGIVALLPYHAKYGENAMGSISLHIRVPNNISAGKYSGTVNLGHTKVVLNMNNSGSTYSATLYANFEVHVPQRCKINFPGSVTFNPINGGVQSLTPLQTKDVNFTSECSGLAETSVKVELLLESDSFDSTIGAVMLDTERTLGVKASLNSTIDCSSKSNELFNKQFLLVEHPKSAGKNTQSKKIHIALCKYGLITKPGEYSKSINAKVIYSTP
ncbi:hypothetical protein AA481_005123 [Salmonella enterica subsp. enterica]|nr:hypothetical protein [Salmonella enterica subsp. enterica serovar Abaetetuba]